MWFNSLRLLFFGLSLLLIAVNLSCAGSSFLFEEADLLFFLDFLDLFPLVCIGGEVFISLLLELLYLLLMVFSCDSFDFIFWL